MKGLQRRREWLVALEAEEAFDDDEADVLKCMQRLADTMQRIPRPKEGVIAEAERVRQRIHIKNPTWNEDLVRLSTAAVIVCGLRANDVSAPEMVALVWLCLGGKSTPRASGLPALL